MSGKKTILITFGFVLSASLIASAVTVLLASYQDSRFTYNLLNRVCGEILEREPTAGSTLSAALKDYVEHPVRPAAEDILSAWGYRASDFSGFSHRQQIIFGAAGVLTGLLFFIVTFLYRNRTETARIQALAEYLEQVNMGKAAVLSVSGEDNFSRLEDEIYKTVTFLYQTRDSALQAKNHFAENLSNVAHQIKTPITAISLSAQMMKRDLKSRHLEQIERQLSRLTRLEEALLVLSRLDAGTLSFQKSEVDVFTLLVLASDNLQELFVHSGVSVEIPELGEIKYSAASCEVFDPRGICQDPMELKSQDLGSSPPEIRITADLDWTMEAVMNLMKNCMEHNPGGTVHCSYAQNPLYTEILIWDDGEGFAKEDIPHLFERFYRGKNAGEGGIGIGLSLAKEIVERQNGTIRARNKLGGGACFEIHFYKLPL